MAQKLKHVIIGLDDYNNVMENCKAEYLRYHPELEGIKINFRFMIKQMIKHYLK